MKKIKILAFLSAVITALLLYVFLSSLGQAEVVESAMVVTASVNIPVNTVITEEMVTLTELPVGAILNRSITEKKLVLGKVSKSEIFPGEQILNGKLISPGDSSNGTLAYAIQPGNRAITISVGSTSGLSGMLKPQNKVDIISDFEYELSTGDRIFYTTMIVENVLILAVDSVLSQEGKSLNTNETASPYLTITLQVTPQQAMELSMSEYKGHLRAILRSPLDETKTNLPSITLDNVVVN